MNPLRVKLWDGSKRNLPGNIAGVGIDCPKLSPGWLLARPEFVVVPKAGIIAPRTFPLVKRIGTVRILDELSNIGQVVGVDEKISQLGIERHSRPVGGPNGSREL